MLLKWIVCRVTNEKKIAFSLAQEQWSFLKGAPGFIAQIGGWNLIDQNEACIFGLWENTEAYQYFMDHIHDQIFLHNLQDKTYESISVIISNKILDISGNNELYQAIRNSEILRVADVTIYPERYDHFIEVQKSVWKLVR